MNLERGLARRPSMVGGTRDMVFRIELIISFQSLFALEFLIEESVGANWNLFGSKGTGDLLVLHK